jgi:hypothetical protein
MRKHDPNCLLGHPLPILLGWRAIGSLGASDGQLSTWVPVRFRNMSLGYFAGLGRFGVAGVHVRGGIFSEGQARSRTVSVETAVEAVALSLRFPRPFLGRIFEGE